jgi:uncharacterized protein YkwD/uncharacterized membrane protein required for colicin V production
LNSVDAILLILLLLFAAQGIRSGFLARGAGLVVLVLSFLVAWGVHQPVAEWLEATFRWHRPVAVAAGFFLPFLLFQSLATAVAARWIARLPERLRRSRLNRVLGVLPALLEGSIFLALALTVLLVLPVAGIPREAITGSRIGSRMVGIGTVIQARTQRLFGDTLRDLLTFRTVSPESQERVTLHFRTDAGQPDPKAEAAMLVLVNRERERQGLEPLVMDQRLREVARRHSRDMLERGYFGHITPEGSEPFQRIRKGGVRYGAAGENLAFAPTVEIAHTGLMESPGHRANILQPRFRRVGIGALRAPPYGIMFTQNFTD